MFFLDYPCDLKRGEKITFVLALHGGGLSGSWMRQYFPIVDFKERYRLVIATPSGTANSWWPEKDDAYLHNIVEEVEAAVGRQNIRAFWLVGHSLGGQTANRLIMDDPFFRDRLTGWVSLSGGRLGSKREEVRVAIPPGSSGPIVGPPTPPGGPVALITDASVLPLRAFSFIYETGSHELPLAGLPATSKWAKALECGAQSRPLLIEDTEGGHIDDARPTSNRNPIWGGEAGPGAAEVYLYPNCAAGRVVADIVRLDKGHTEGLEPRVSEEIVQLMVSAR